LYNRKALKMFTPISVDASDSDELKSILNEIEVLKKLSSTSDYVINYLDSFSTDVGNHIIYYIVTSIYEVKLCKLYIKHNSVRFSTVTVTVAWPSRYIPGKFIINSKIYA
jgi:serine/threonine protein kinase